MNPNILVRLSNFIGAISIILLLYWVFVFICIEVFRLRVFRENITETFYLSIIGILSLMFGALIINVMFNLTRIAEKHNEDANYQISKNIKGLKWVFFLSFPVICAFLFIGDFLSSKKKEELLIQSAKSIIDSNPKSTEHLSEYSFTETWLTQTEDILDHFSNMDENFPGISVITADTINSNKTFLSFHYYNDDDTTRPGKKDYILRTSKEERDYLNNVFEHGNKQTRFSAADGRYELFYPYFFNGRVIVLHFSDYQRYGKLGS